MGGSTNSASSASNRLYIPADVTFDGNGYMYVVDRGNNRIQRFPPGTNCTGCLMLNRSLFLLGSTSSTAAVTIAGFSGGGSSLSELSDPFGIHLDTDGTMYIIDTSNYRVLKWIVGQPMGVVVAGGRGSGSTLDKIGTSYALYVDDQSNIYVSEYTNHRVTLWMNGNTTAGSRVRRSTNFLCLCRNTCI